jgi:hypothetical protein
VRRRFLIPRIRSSERCRQLRAAHPRIFFGEMSMTKSAPILITFAWAMEIVGVAGGALNSTYTTFGDDLPTSLVGYIPAVPMVALAAAEFGRVPLASVIYEKHKVIQAVAMLGILALGYLAVENWTFGFERVVDLRLKPVNAVARDVERAEAELSRLKDERDHRVESGGKKRQELRTGISQRDAGIAELTAQLGKEAEVHQKNLDGIREACRIIKDRCMVPRSQAEDTRYAAAVSRLGSELERQRDERKQLQSQIDQLVSVDAADAAEIDRLIAAAEGVVSDSHKAFRAAADGSQIYRLAANWYGVSMSDVTPKQLATARWAFSTFSAIAVALAGSVAALVHYARNRASGGLSLLNSLNAKIARARRAYYARKRRPLKIEIPGPERMIYRDGKEPPVVVEKEVVRWIDRIILIPRWGIRIPFHVNPRNGRSDQIPGAPPEETAEGSSVSNLMHLKKVN